MTPNWSIGIYFGDSPFSFARAQCARNPVIKASDVSDVDADFVADPFMIKRDHKWYMFFEVFNRQKNIGQIGMADSRDALRWNYRQIVLSEPFHLSYPYVFSWNREVFMVPETLGAGTVRLYRGAPFPNVWIPVEDLLIGEFADSSFLYFDSRWWMFTCSTPWQHHTLELYM